MFYGGRRIIMRSKNINKQKDARNEEAYEESSVSDEVLSYLNIFECGRNILNRLDLKYERACMAKKNYTKFKMHHCQMGSFNKQSVQSRQKRKRKNLKQNVIPII